MFASCLIRCLYEPTSSYFTRITSDAVRSVVVVEITVVTLVFCVVSDAAYTLVYTYSMTFPIKT